MEDAEYPAGSETHARRQLLERRLPVNRIAQRCGFGSEETVCRSLLRLMATTPQNYRTRFGS
jgi:AraC-like DNA-binding protein